MKKLYKTILNFGTNECVIECVKDDKGNVNCKECELNKKVLLGNNNIMTICDTLIQMRESLTKRL